jgi:hypothetical protein
MATTLTGTNTLQNDNQREYIMDTDGEIDNLPELSNNCSQGSTAFSIQSGKVFMLSGDNEWREI